MQAPRKLAVLLLAALLGNCASAPDSKKPVVSGLAAPEFKTLQDMLPGAYSDFARRQEQDADAPVTDLRIRQLITDGEPVFLFEQELRGQEVYSYDLYWLKRNHQAQRAELYFTRLDQDELSLSMQQTLAIAWQRVLPGCVMPINRVGERFEARTDPGTCVFENPLQGRTRLLRSLSIDAETLALRNELEDPRGRPTGDRTALVLKQHKVFVGWASIRIEARTEQDTPGQWQLSQVFSTRDDGRVNHLYDQTMTPMAFGLQLARLHRFEGEPDYYKVSVINLENGQTQAYQWFEPGSGAMNVNLDWFQASLEPARLEDTQP